MTTTTTKKQAQRSGIPGRKSFCDADNARSVARDEPP
jgi:hypothetical protein